MKISNKEFNPPKLPFVALCGTVVVPVLVAVIPLLIKSADYDFKTTLIIALIIWCIELFVFCFCVILNLYNSEFKAQIINYEYEQTSHQLKIAEEDMEHLRKQLYTFSQKLENNNK